MSDALRWMLARAAALAGEWSPHLSDALVALVAAVALTAVADRLPGRWRGISALGWVPFLFVIAVMADSGSVGWAHVAMLAAAAFVASAYELARGGIGYGVAALACEVAAWLALADVLALAPDATIALLVVVAATWFVGSRLMGPLTSDPTSSPHAGTYAVVIGCAAWSLLAGATLLLPEALMSARDSGWALVVPREVALAVVFTLGWASGARLMRAWPAAGVAIAGSLLATGLLATGLAPHLHLAYIGCILCATVAFWLHVPEAARGLFAPQAGQVTAWVAGSGLFGLAIFLLVSGPVHAQWPVVALLGTLALLWISQAIRYRQWYAAVPAALSFIAAATVTGVLLQSVGS